MPAKRHGHGLLVFISNTRNTFCVTWYVPHSQVHNERTFPMTGCIAHARNGHIFTSALKSESPSCSSTPISLMTRIPPRKFRRFGHKGYIAYFSLRMRDTAVFPLPISQKTRKFRRFAYI